MKVDSASLQTVFNAVNVNQKLLISVFLYSGSEQYENNIAQCFNYDSSVSSVSLSSAQLSCVCTECDIKPRSPAFIHHEIPFASIKLQHVHDALCHLI